MADKVEFYGTGRRKRAVARVFLRPGNGDIKVNGKTFDEHFVTVAQRIEARQSLAVSETAGSFDAVITVDGGGVNGQAGAVKMGIARALIIFNPELRPKLKAAGMLRRDPRQKERKKYGQKGARKRFQFSKR
jgi:small subunit ribosomal protein S9